MVTKKISELSAAARYRHHDRACRTGWGDQKATLTQVQTSMGVATQTYVDDADALLVPLSSVQEPDGVAGLDPTGRVIGSQLFGVSTQTEDYILTTADCNSYMLFDSAIPVTLDTYRPGSHGSGVVGRDHPGRCRPGVTGNGHEHNQWSGPDPARPALGREAPRRRHRHFHAVRRPDCPVNGWTLVDFWTGVTGLDSWTQIGSWSQNGSTGKTPSRRVRSSTHQAPTGSE